MPELVFTWPSQGEPVWRHARIQAGDACPFSGLPEDVWEALSDAQTRPHCAQLEGGYLLVMRGVNVNPGNQPEDMVSVRMWLGAGGLVSVTLRRVFAIEDTLQALSDEVIPSDAGAIALFLAERLAARIRDAVLVMDDATHEVEERLLAPDASDQVNRLQDDIRRIRRRAVLLRRYLAPQSAAIDDFRTLAGRNLGKDLQEDLGELANETQRAAEAVQSLAEYGGVLQDQLDAIHDARMARTSYMLGLVAAIFLPLNLVAAVFGANVGGVPWMEDPLGFVYLSILCAVITGLGVWLVRWRRWV